jgi:two-component system cell cycle response regulator DivK
MTPTLLYIEDNPNHARLVRKILGARGINVIVSGDGLQGVAMAARENPDLIMVDMNLPDMTGEAVVSRLRGDRSRVSGIPIIAVTASTDSDLRARVVAAGCDGYVQKPYTTKELLAAVKAHLAAVEKV